MNELKNILEQNLNDNFISAVLSNPRDEKLSAKVKVRPVLMKDTRVYQMETFRGNQAFHENLSADEKKRLEYEYREKCIRDHSAAIQSAAQHGFEEGIQKGKSELILNMNAAGYPISEISKNANLAEEEVQEILQKK